MLASHSPPTAVSGQQHPHGSSLRPLTLFQKTQMEAEEVFYAVFPEARLAKLAEQQLMYDTLSAFHYDIHPEPTQCHVDLSGTEYVDGAYIAVGGDRFSSPSYLLHYDHGLSNTNPTASFQSIPSIPNPVSGSGFMTMLMHSSHHNSSPLEYTESPRFSEPYFPPSPVPALVQAISPAPSPLMLEPVFEPYRNHHFPQQPALFEQAYTTLIPRFPPAPVETSSQGYFYPPPPDTPPDLATSPQIEHGDMPQDGIFRAVVPGKPHHHSVGGPGGRTIEHHRRSQGRLTPSSSLRAHRNRDHHRLGHGHRLSRSHSHTSLPRQPECVPQQDIPSAGSQPTPPGSFMSLSPLPSKRQLEKRLPLACFFCRGRKIACGPPMPGSPNKTCNQCQKRSLCCQYPSESRRGMRKKKTTGDDSASLSPKQPNPDFCVPDASIPDLPKPAA